MAAIVLGQPRLRTNYTMNAVNSINPTPEYGTPYLRLVAL